MNLFSEQEVKENISRVIELSNALEEAFPSARRADTDFLQSMNWSEALDMLKEYNSRRDMLDIAKRDGHELSEMIACMDDMLPSSRESLNCKVTLQTMAAWDEGVISFGKNPPQADKATEEAEAIKDGCQLIRGEITGEMLASMFVKEAGISRPLHIETGAPINPKIMEDIEERSMFAVAVLEKNEVAREDLAAKSPDLFNNILLVEQERRKELEREKNLPPHVLDIQPMPLEGKAWREVTMARVRPMEDPDAAKARIAKTYKGLQDIHIGTGKKRFSPDDVKKISDEINKQTNKQPAKVQIKKNDERT